MRQDVGYSMKEVGGFSLPVQVCPILHHDILVNIVEYPPVLPLHQGHGDQVHLGSCQLLAKGADKGQMRGSRGLGGPVLPAC